MNSLAIIVLNWNGADDTLNCVESLQQQTLRPEIIIVDNNSNDDSVERFEDHIKSQKKDAPILIKNIQNLGGSSKECSGHQSKRDTGQP